MTTTEATVPDVAPPSTGRAPLITQAGLFALFVLLIVLPYYAHGLHHQPTAQVEGGMFDPKALTPFDLPVIGVPLQYLQVLVFADGWLLAAVLSLWAAARSFVGPMGAARARYAVAAVLGVVFIAIHFSSYGQHLGLWIAD